MTQTSYPSEQTTTLAQYLFEEQHKHDLCPKLCLLIEHMARQCQAIGQRVRQGSLGGVLGSMGTENVQGEVQQKLDLIANDMLLQDNDWHQGLAALASEEMDTIHPLPNREQAPYLLLFDPLDGSSNIDVNTSIGTIFSILKNPGTALNEQSFLQPGTQQVAAGYAVYGPQTMLVFSLGHGVVGFTLDPYLGIWKLTHPRLEIPRQTKEFAINMSNMRHWHAPIRTYIEHCLQGEEGPLAKNYNMRWIASMVADVHRVLVRGGVFMYPSDQRPGVEHGKLRLLYEANPMSFLVTQAGGHAITLDTPILEVQPTALHQRVSVILGSLDEVQRIEQYLQDAD